MFTWFTVMTWIILIIQMKLNSLSDCIKQMKQEPWTAVLAEEFTTILQHNRENWVLPMLLFLFAPTYNCHNCTYMATITSSTTQQHKNIIGKNIVKDQSSNKMQRIITDKGSMDSYIFLCDVTGVWLDEYQWHRLQDQLLASSDTDLFAVIF